MTASNIIYYDLKITGEISHNITYIATGLKVIFDPILFYMLLTSVKFFFHCYENDKKINDRHHTKPYCIKIFIYALIIFEIGRCMITILVRMFKERDSLFYLCEIIITYIGYIALDLFEYSGFLALFAYQCKAQLKLRIHSE